MMAENVQWRVMCVDDDQALLDSLVRILETEFEVVGAINGLDALEKIEHYEPDLIVLDVSMPCVDGIDTCRAIRKNVRFKDVPVVFLSGQDETSYCERAKGLGVTKFLRKPVTPSHVLQVCLDALQQTGAVFPPLKRLTITELESNYSESAERRRAIAPLVGLVDPDQTPTLEQVGGRPDLGPTQARIMIVDDSTDAIGLALDALRDRFEVFGVHEPVSAIYKIIRYQPDLLILEIAMPRISGYQLSQLLRLNRNLRTIQILFMSSKNSPQEIEYARKLGAADYLVKPFRPEELLAKVTAITESPDFIIREKALSFEDIRRAERTTPAPSQFL